jgi:hypothetical protein
MTDRKNTTPGDQPRKMSQMISEMAAHFIGVGQTAEDKHHRLTAACSAGNSLSSTSKSTGDSILRLLPTTWPESIKTSKLSLNGSCKCFQMTAGKLSMPGS